MASGLLEIISPPASFYPNLDDLRVTLNDPLERVKWRTKQNLDYAFLMMYAIGRGTYYVQLEDDILTTSGYISKMVKYALTSTNSKIDWFILDFCQLGFIGNLLFVAMLIDFIYSSNLLFSELFNTSLLSSFNSKYLCREDQVEVRSRFGNNSFIFIDFVFVRQSIDNGNYSCLKLINQIENWLVFLDFQVKCLRVLIYPTSSSSRSCSIMINQSTGYWVLW